MPQRSDFPNKERKPSRPPTHQRQTDTRVEWRGYVNIPLNEADKRHYFAWRTQPDVLTETTHAILRAGFKLSVDFQEREAAYRASLYCQNPGLSEAGYCLSIFASTSDEAVMRLLYVHAVKAQFKWGAWLSPKSKVEDWDEYQD